MGTKTGTKTHLRNVSQSGCGDTTVREDVQNVRQTGSGDLIVHGNVAGNVQQTGSGDITINGNARGNVSQVGCGDVNIKGDVHGNISQTGCGTINIGGKIYGQVSKLGCGDIHIRRTRRKKSKTGSATRSNEQILRTDVQQHVYRQPQSYGYSFRYIYQTSGIKLITGSARNVKEKTQNCARILAGGARRCLVSGLQMIYHMAASSSNSTQKPAKQIKGTSSINVKKELECPVCFDIPQNEIYQCKNGHMICANCCSKIDTCPQCRCNLKIDGILIRNRLAETLVAKNKYL